MTKEFVEERKIAELLGKIPFCGKGTLEDVYIDGECFRSRLATVDIKADVCGRLSIWATNPAIGQGWGYNLTLQQAMAVFEKPEFKARNGSGAQNEPELRRPWKISPQHGYKI